MSTAQPDPQRRVRVRGSRFEDPTELLINYVECPVMTICQLQPARGDAILAWELRNNRDGEPGIQAMIFMSLFKPISFPRFEADARAQDPRPASTKWLADRVDGQPGCQRNGDVLPGWQGWPRGGREPHVATLLSRGSRPLSSSPRHQARNLAVSQGGSLTQGHLELGGLANRCWGRSRWYAAWRCRCGSGLLLQAEDPELGMSS